ncbi:hypothetical protein CARUB_v10011418mg [Capsella rubella]|uniref:Uncharacterized protein n=1 Tax=Capsella rubella TaxID=81985 RepID=R0GPG4_9BRAS|nr:hypothetical protein CARUB_v10011418mg [Capsella rubella]
MYPPPPSNIYAPPMLVNCSGCRTPLQLPSGARSIRCALCQAVTHIADPRTAPPPPPHTPSSASPPPPHINAPPGQLAHPHGRKRAVICGISYRFSRHELKGCINDAKCMRHLLINKFKFSPDSILMLTEEETDPYRIPTKQNMRMALYWLVQGCTAGDSLVFHYSGHGSRQRNYNGDEVDGYDETLCPLDFETQGMIVDDEINATIVRPLPHGVKLHSIIDACHSGTVLDLPFLSIERSTQGTTYGSILNSMRTTIRNTGNDGGGIGGSGVVTTVLSMLLTGGSAIGGLRQSEGGIFSTIAKEKAPKESTFMQPSHSHPNLAEDMACYGSKSGKFNTTVWGKNLSEVVFRGFTDESVVDIAIPIAELNILEGHAAKTRTLIQFAEFPRCSVLVQDAHHFMSWVSCNHYNT